MVAVKMPIEVARSYVQTIYTTPAATVIREAIMEADSADDTVTTVAPEKRDRREAYW